MSDVNRVLFVCMGNICRSPLAEGVFLHLSRERGVEKLFEVDSCGTGGWHVGEPPDARMLEVARRRGIELTSRARQVDILTDFDRFHYLIAMDRDNRDHLLHAGAPAGKVHLMRSFDPTLDPGREHDVPDPYYGGAEGFDRVFEMVHRACAGLLDHLTGQRGSPVR